ncbi:hypothetical protein [Embleya sp. NPDC050493]|uniref:hypothetical protein n=1 Tax=Embleya sp. NPDC050493 TaxID=3363989 RepID=UPI0037A14C5C
MAGKITVVRGEAITLPETLAEIRAALPPDQRDAFDEEMYNTPLDQIERRALLGWALPPEAHEEDEEAAARIRAGDYSGMYDNEGNPVERRGRP